MTDQERSEMCEIHFGMVEVVVEALLSAERNHKYKKFRDDLYGIAYITLVRASKKFDDQKGFQFRTYASNAIRYELINQFKRYDKQYYREWSIEDVVGTPLEPRSDEQSWETDSYKALVKRLEPKEELNKIVYYELIIGDNNFRQLAEQLEIKNPHKLYKRKQAILKKLKVQLEKIRV